MKSIPLFGCSQSIHSVRILILIRQMNGPARIINDKVIDRGGHYYILQQAFRGVSLPEWLINQYWQYRKAERQTNCENDDLLCLVKGLTWTFDWALYLHLCLPNLTDPRCNDDLPQLRDEGKICWRRCRQKLALLFHREKGRARAMYLSYALTNWRRSEIFNEYLPKASNQRRRSGLMFTILIYAICPAR